MKEFDDSPDKEFLEETTDLELEFHQVGEGEKHKLVGEGEKDEKHLPKPHYLRKLL